MTPASCQGRGKEVPALNHGFLPNQAACLCDRGNCQLHAPVVGCARDMRVRLHHTALQPESRADAAELLAS
jgi:hypothetical protein